jgi:DNA (cytosine-5)-methyltransferase 1
MNRTAISLFSGGGGLDIGVEQAGFQTMAAVEIDGYSCETLRANKWLGSATVAEFEHWFDSTASTALKSRGTAFVEHERERIMSGVGKHKYLAEATILERDIATVSGEELLQYAGVAHGELDLLFGGPPCQPFSRAGRRNSINEDRGQLFMHFVRLAAELRPRWVLFENVKGLAQTKATIWSVRCEECGSDALPPFDHTRTAPVAGQSAPACSICGATSTSWTVHKNKPGASLDVVLAEFKRIGYECHWRLINSADFGVPQKRERLFIVASRDHEEYSFPNPTHAPVGATDGPHQPYRTVRQVLFSEPNPAHPWPLPEEAVMWVKNVVRPHDEPVTWTLDTLSPTIGAHQGAKLAIAHTGVPEAQLLRQQWHVLGQRQGDTPPVHVDHTYLSDSDLLRLQTFPEYWYLAGTRMERAFQVGNAVPPLMARAVAARCVSLVPEVVV